MTEWLSVLVHRLVCSQCVEPPPLGPLVLVAGPGHHLCRIGEEGRGTGEKEGDDVGSATSSQRKAKREHRQASAAKRKKLVADVRNKFEGKKGG